MEIVSVVIVCLCAGGYLLWFARRTIQKGADANSLDLIVAPFALIFGVICILAAILMPAITLSQRGL